MKVLDFFQLPSITRTRAIASGFQSAADAIQAQAEQVNATTATVFLAQKPAENQDQKRAYKARLDEIHAQAVAMLRAKGR